jgi:hypothetical protein
MGSSESFISNRAASAAAHNFRHLHLHYPRLEVDEARCVPPHTIPAMVSADRRPSFVEKANRGSIVFISVAKGARDNYGAYESRKELRRSARCQTLSHQLLVTHLEEALHLRRDSLRQIVRRRSENRARAHMGILYGRPA